METKTKVAIGVTLGLGAIVLGVFALTRRAQAAPPPPPPPPGYANLYGVVTNKNTGVVLPGAHIVIDGNGIYSSDADASGTYLIQSAAPGVLGLTCTLAGYQTVTQAITLVEGNNSLNIQLTPVAPLAWQYTNGLGYYESTVTPLNVSRTILEMDIKNPGAQVTTKRVTLWWRLWGTVEGNWGQGEYIYDGENPTYIQSREITIEPGETYHYIGYLALARNNWGWIASVGATVQQQLRDSDGGESPIVSFVAH
jgi:hypothetical protein